MHAKKQDIYSKSHGQKNTYAGVCRLEKALTLRSHSKRCVRTKSFAAVSPNTIKSVEERYGHIMDI